MFPFDLDCLLEFFHQHMMQKQLSTGVGGAIIKYRQLFTIEKRIISVGSEHIRSGDVYVCNKPAGHQLWQNYTFKYVDSVV